MAVGLALKEGLPQCQPVLLEPVLDVDRLGAVRLHRQGAAAADPAPRPDPGLRGQGRLVAAGTRSRRTSRRARSHDLIVSLRSQSQGTGFFEWKHDHLQEVPEALTKSIVEHYKAEQPA